MIKKSIALFLSAPQMLCSVFHACSESKMIAEQLGRIKPEYLVLTGISLSFLSLWRTGSGTSSCDHPGTLALVAPSSWNNGRLHHVIGWFLHWGCRFWQGRWGGIHWWGRSLLYSWEETVSGPGRNANGHQQLVRRLFSPFDFFLFRSWLVLSNRPEHAYNYFSNAEIERVCWWTRKGQRSSPCSQVPSRQNKYKLKHNESSFYWWTKYNTGAFSITVC